MLDVALHTTSPQWAERARVVQEVILARFIYLCFGRRRIFIDLELLRVVTELSVNNDLSSKAHVSLKFRTLVDFLWGCELMGIRREWEVMPGMKISDTDLYELLYPTRGVQLAEPRDRIFSLLGLAQVADCENITTDYTIPLLTVFTRATFACLKGSQKAPAMFLAVRLTRQPDQGLPSWAVDFMDLLGDPIYNHGRYMSAAISERCLLEPGDLTLRIKGTVLDSITKCLRISEDDSNIDTVRDYTRLTASKESIPAFIDSTPISTVSESCLEQGITSASTAETNHLAVYTVPQPAGSEQAHGNIGAAPTSKLGITAPRDSIGEFASWVSRWAHVSSRVVDHTWIHTYQFEYGKDLGKRRLWYSSRIDFIKRYAAWTAGGTSIFATPAGIIGFAPCTISEWPSAR